MAPGRLFIRRVVGLQRQASVHTRIDKVGLKETKQTKGA